MPPLATVQQTCPDPIPTAGWSGRRGYVISAGMRLVGIMNPVAGASKQKAQIRALVARLRAGGHHFEWLHTAAPGDSRRMAAAARGGADAVIAIGGDGTVCEVVHGLAGGETPLLIWPTGTENLVARSLGFFPRPECILSCLAASRVVAVDVGVANGHSFLVVLGAGFDAEVVHWLHRIRSGHITHLSYTGPLWRTFWEHRFPEIRVIAEGREYWQGRGLVFVGNMARYALGLPVIRDAVPTDGLLDLCILVCSGRAGLIGHSLRTLLARHIEHPAVRYKRIHRARIESAAAVPVEIDGDPGGMLPVDVEVRPGAVKVLLNPAVNLHTPPAPQETCSACLPP